MSLRFTRSARNSLLAVTALLILLLSMDRDADGDSPVPTRIPAHSSVPAIAKVAKPVTPPEPRPDTLIGDKSLRGTFNLGKRKLAGDHYEVRLDDGATAILTLNPKIQEAAEKTLAHAKAPQAAIVVMHTDGRVLALAGRELRAPDVPAPELATSVWAPAASIFKIVTSAALLKAGVSSKKKLCYHGGLRSIEASNLSDHGKLDSTCNDLGYALAKSQNALLAKFVNKHLSKQRLASMSKLFGLETAPEFALETEAGRVNLPDDPLEFARVSAGFWNSDISALHGAMMANLVASGGLQVTPRIISEVRELDRTIPVQAEKPVRVLHASTARALAEMMEGTVRYGTAAKGFYDRRGRPYLGKVTVAGKTGSLSRNEPTYLGYSWFVGFAPADKPEIVIAVLLGNPAKWYLKAHTAARLVLQSAL